MVAFFQFLARGVIKDIPQILLNFFVTYLRYYLLQS